MSSVQWTTDCQCQLCRSMDPKHVLHALALMYLREHDGKIEVSMKGLREVSEFPQTVVQISQRHRVDRDPVLTVQIARNPFME